jgi:hypothetical protein
VFWCDHTGTWPLTLGTPSSILVKVALIPPLPFGDRLVLFRRILPLLVGTTLVPKWPRHTLFFLQNVRLGIHVVLPYEAICQWKLQVSIFKI